MSKSNNLLKILLVVYIILGIFLRWKELDFINLIDWWTRDFDRAFSLFDGDYFPLAGPESTGGGRLPGPFLSLFLAIPLLFHRSYESIFFFNFLLSSGSLVFMFFVVRRYFEFRIAAISTILFSIHILNVYAISYPINPSFLPVFLICFLGLFLEFILKKDLRAFSLMFLIINLVSQIHFSIATYYLVVIAGVVVFRIKIPLKNILITVLLTLACFSPYLFYKGNYFEADSPPRAYIKANEGLSTSLLNWLNIISVHKTINRVALSHWTDKIPFYFDPSYYSLTHYILLTAGFYGLVLFIVYLSIKKGIEFYKKEIALILLFYIPALIFAYLSPTEKHWWYIFIFLPSSTIICAIAIEAILKTAKTLIPFVGVFAILLLTLSYLTYFPFKNIEVQKSHYQNTGWGTINYFPLKNLIKDLASELNLSPEEYAQRVFFDPYSPNSLKLLGLAVEEKSTNPPLIGSAAQKKPCYYIFNRNVIKRGLKEKSKNNYREFKVESRLNLFLDDPTLTIESYRELLLVKKGSYGEMMFVVYQYRPKLNQPCYRNSNNQFNVTQKTRKLLSESYGINKAKQFKIKEIKNEKLFNGQGELEKLEGVYFIFEPQSQTPIRFKLNLKRVGENYTLRGDLDFYAYTYFSSPLRFRLDQFAIFLGGEKNQSISSEELFKFDIIPPDSWIQNNIESERMINKLDWYREMKLPREISFVKDKSQIKISLAFKFLKDHVDYPEGQYVKRSFTIDI